MSNKTNIEEIISEIKAHLPVYFVPSFNTIIAKKDWWRDGFIEDYYLVLTECIESGKDVVSPLNALDTYLKKVPIVANDAPKDEELWNEAETRVEAKKEELNYSTFAFNDVLPEEAKDFESVNDILSTEDELPRSYNDNELWNDVETRNDILETVNELDNMLNENKEEILNEEDLTEEAEEQ